jgi:hypothetical protein
MIGMKQFCALLLAGGMGAGSVVTVQQAKPVAGKVRAQPKPAKVHKAVQQARQASEGRDCPTIASLDQGFDVASPLPGPDTLFGPALSGGAIASSGGGGGGGGSGGSFGPGIRPGPVPVVPGVPQPDSWIMLVAGFGFLGLALRRRPVETATRDVGR